MPTTASPEHPDSHAVADDPAAELAVAEALLEALVQRPTECVTRDQLAAFCGLDDPALEALIRRHCHLDVATFLQRHRVHTLADALRLDPQGAPSADILGWPDPAQAVIVFRRHLGMSPQDYGRLPGRRTFTMQLPRSFRRKSMLTYLGRDPGSLYERVDGHRFRFAFATTEGAVAVSAQLEASHADCRLDGVGADCPTAAHQALHRLRRYLGLVISPEAFERRLQDDPLHQRLVGPRQGLSIPQTPTPFDGLIWVIAGQQVSLPVAFSLRRRLGEACASRLDDDLWLPPRPEDVAALDHDALRACGWSQRKSEYLYDLARAVAEDDLNLDRLMQSSAVRLRQTLLARRGLGPWSVQYLMMRSFGLADCVPVGDAGLKRSLQRFFDLPQRPDAETTWRLMAPFAPYRSLASFHFWALESDH